MLDGIFVIGSRPLDPFAATFLSFIRDQRGSLDVAASRQRDHHRFFGDQRFLVIVAQFFQRHIRAAFVPILGLQLFHVFTDDSADVSLIAEQVQILSDVFQQLSMLALQFFAFQIGQRTKLH